MSDVETLLNFKLTFDNYGEDIERYIEELISQGVKEQGITKQKNMSIAQIANEEVFRAYSKKGLWLLIASDVDIDSHDYYMDLELTEGLIELKAYPKVKQKWRRRLSDLKAQYWMYYRNKRKSPVDGKYYDQFNDEIPWPQIKDEVLEGFRVYREYVIKMDNQAELTWVEDEIRLLEVEKKREPRNKTTESTKIDEAMFWDIINSAVSESTKSGEEKVEIITNRLEDFKVAEIKRFQNILLDRLDQLNTWDLWALIYIAQDGCSDDSFLDFRCWIIFQGKTFFDQCLSNIEDTMCDVPGDGSASNENLLNAADQAYNIRSGGKVMTLPVRKETGPSGVEWDENEVSALYPNISAYYKK